MTSDQRGLHLVLRPGTDLAWLLYPRLRGEKPPAITPLGRPEALKVESPRGTDYVFLSPSPIRVRVGDVGFEGTAGVVQVRGQQLTLTLPQPGELSLGDRRLRSDGPASRRW